MKHLIAILFLFMSVKSIACPGHSDLEKILGIPVVHAEAQINHTGMYLLLENEDDLSSEIQSEEYRWLFEKLIDENVRQAYPDESWKSFRVHLKDSYKTFQDPAEIKAENLQSYRTPTELTGKITYVGIVKKPYRMTISTDKDGIQVAVRVHLQNATAQDINSFSEKAKFAENMWNQYRIQTNFKYRFKFEIVENSSQAHFSVQVQDETRGPYDTYWGRDWTGTVLAHEIGHMMGLADEYKTISGEFDCLRDSLMCSAWYGSHMPHHYYFILRRLLKAN